MCKTKKLNIADPKAQLITQPSNSMVDVAVEEHLFSEQEVKHLQYKTNTTWTIVLLIAIILILIASFFVIKMFDNDDVKERIMTIIGVASTLLAITLSGFSIFYSYFSTKESSSILFRVSNEVKQIGRTYSLLQSNQGDLIKFIANNQVRGNTLPSVTNDVAKVQGANMTPNNVPSNPAATNLTPNSSTETPATDTKENKANTPQKKASKSKKD